MQSGDAEVAPQTRTLRGEISVSSRIIDQLSSGLYEDPAACLKELINNAYDADATVVTMSMRPDANLIVIEDDGEGFAPDAFERHFSRIARSYKREVSEYTHKKRAKIGKIGIGFIAANEICERLVIESTVRGSNERMRVELDFELMRQDVTERQRSNDAISKGDYSGQVYTDAPIDAHYTRLVLTGVRDRAQAIMSGAARNEGDDSLYGATVETVRSKLLEPSLRDWDQFDDYSETLLKIALNVPVKYHDNWHPPSGAHYFDRFTAEVAAGDFRLIVDGTEQRKPILLDPSANDFEARSFEFSGKHVAAHGYLFARGGRIAPFNLKGVLVRLRGAAVGAYDPSFMGFPTTSGALFQNWTTGELFVDAQYDDMINIDRRTFRTMHPAYLELQRLFHAELDEFLSDVRRNLYGSRSASRKTARAHGEADRIRQALGGTSSPPEAAPTRAKSLASKEISSALSEPTLPPEAIRALSRQYSPEEVLKVVRRAALDIGMSGTDVNRLLEQVARELLW